MHCDALRGSAMQCTALQIIEQMKCSQDEGSLFKRICGIDPAMDRINLFSATQHFLNHILKPIYSFTINSFISIIHADDATGWS